MNKKQQKVFISVTSKGFGAMWERGGKNLKGNGYSLLITDSTYDRKVAIATKSDVCGRHALIPIKEGDLVIETKCNKNDKQQYSINIWRIDKVDPDTKTALLEIINNFYGGNWDYQLTPNAEEAVSFAVQKANTEACNQPCYCIVKIKEKKQEAK